MPTQKITPLATFVLTVALGASAADAQKMYWTSGSATPKIQRASLDGSNVEDLITMGLADSFGIDLDLGAGKMYWVEENGPAVRRANLDGSGVENLVTVGVTGPTGIALDLGGGKIYWADFEGSRIQRANLDGSNVEDLTTAASFPVDIALDVAAGKMYWTENVDRKIRRANLDGSSVETLLTLGSAEFPTAIALDVSGGKMYWTQIGTDKIRRANLNGSGPEDLVSLGLTSPFGIALDLRAGKMYWIDVGAIRRANLDGTNVQDVATALSSPELIALDLPLFVDVDAAGANNGTSWADAFTDLQNALAVAAASGGTIQEIWVAEGTYTPTAPGGARSATFQLISGVGLYGGFNGTETLRTQRQPEINVTTLSGDLNGDDVAVSDPGDLLTEPTRAENSFHVVTGDGADATAILDGFIVKAGNADLIGFPGGGMVITSGSPTLRNCTFSNNSANGAGGMWISENSSPMITDCTFIANSASGFGGLGGAMTIVTGSVPTVRDCTFAGNTALQAGGVQNQTDTTFVGCRFLGNSASGLCGGVCNQLGTPLFINCVFSGNSANGGGAMANDFSSSPTLINCTISRNTAVFDGAGIWNAGGSSLTLSNSILWANSGVGGFDQDAQILILPSSGTTVVTYSVIKGLNGSLGGVGNIGKDPMFVDADGADDIVGTLDDDLRITTVSPCIDAGDNNALPADTFDLDGDGDTAEPIPFDFGGNLRRVDIAYVDPDPGNAGLLGSPVVDMGAFEFFIDCQPNGIPDDIDIITGTSFDTNGDGIPDECSLWSAAAGDNLYSTALNWTPPITPVNNIPPGALYSPVISGPANTVILDISPTVDFLNILDGATLNATGGNLTIATDAGMLVDGNLNLGNGFSIFSSGPIAVQQRSALPPLSLGGCVPPPGSTQGINLSGSGLVDATRLIGSTCSEILVSDSIQVMVNGPMSLDSGALYAADPNRSGPTSASLTADSLSINSVAAGAGKMRLVDDMVVTINGDVILSASDSSLVAPANGNLSNAPLGGCVPPPTITLSDRANLIITGDLIMTSCGRTAIGSVAFESLASDRADRDAGTTQELLTSIVVLGGSLVNRITDPLSFDWTNGVLSLNGAAVSPQLIEVAGVDLGPVQAGFTDNFAIGTLAVGSTDVTFKDGLVNTTGNEVLYVHNLSFDALSTIRVDGVKVYYEHLSDSGATISLVNGGQLIQICAQDADCNDGEVCSRDQCIGGACQHGPNLYGDVNHDDAINIFDLFCILNGFGGDFSNNCSFESDDLQPCTGNGTIDIFDLFAVLNAFSGTDPCCTPPP